MKTSLGMFGKNWLRIQKDKEEMKLKMRKVHVAYSILDTIEVPDDWTYEQIQELCIENFYNGNVVMEYNDLEWDFV